MTFRQPSNRFVVLSIIILAATTCTMFALVCLGDDKAVAALTVIAITLSGIGIAVLTFFLTKKKCPRPPVVLHNVRPNASNIPDRPPVPSYTLAFVPPFPVPPPQIIGNVSTAFITPTHPSNPPTYAESAEIEDRRITDSSNAPPAYSRTNYVSDNNIASFSPPPFYTPPIPLFGTSVQTSTMFLSSEDIAVSPSPVPSSPVHLHIRSPSPVRRHPARKPRRSPRQPTPHQTVIGLEDNQSGASTSTDAPKNPSRTSLPQLFIDCSKAEPALFTINGEESMI